MYFPSCFSVMGAGRWGGGACVLYDDQGVQVGMFFCCHPDVMCFIIGEQGVVWFIPCIP